jgi:hypothetical protein
MENIKYYAYSTIIILAAIYFAILLIDNRKKDVPQNKPIDKDFPEFNNN